VLRHDPVLLDADARSFVLCAIVLAAVAKALTDLAAFLGSAPMQLGVFATALGRRSSLLRQLALFFGGHGWPFRYGRLAPTR
jgi:hypothetical protein